MPSPILHTPRTYASVPELVVSSKKFTNIGKTIRITAIHVHYDLAVPSDAREGTERALMLHPQGCPAHQSVKDAIAITWDATLRLGDETVSVRGGESDGSGDKMMMEKK